MAHLLHRTRGQIWKRVYLLMEAGRSFTQKLEAKYERELLLRGRPQLFTWKLEANSGRELTPSWKMVHLLPENWRPNMEWNYFLMEDSGSFTWKLEAKKGRELTSSWQTADL
jgi:hypothetical protein